MLMMQKDEARYSHDTAHGLRHDQNVQGSHFYSAQAAYRAFCWLVINQKVTGGSTYACCRVWRNVICVRSSLCLASLGSLVKMEGDISDRSRVFWPSFKVLDAQARASPVCYGMPTSVQFQPLPKVRNSR